MCHMHIIQQTRLSHNSFDYSNTIKIITLEELLDWIRCLRDCLSNIAESFLVIQESHKPEVEVIHRNNFHEFLRWLLLILALVGSLYLS